VVLELDDVSAADGDAAGPVVVAEDDER